MTENGPIPTSHIIVGTKAQFIKMAPICRLLQDRGWPYRILDLGQHGSITPGILRDFGVYAAPVYVLPSGVTVASYLQALRWVGQAIRRLSAPRRRLRQVLLKDPPGYALVHGDTLSTLLGMYLARRLGLKLGLVEAGLSSGHLLDPFPEEWIRRHVERRADFLFAPDEESARRLSTRGLKGQVVSTGYNTGLDALLLIARLHSKKVDRPEISGTVLTLHRAETISRAARLRELTEYVIRMAPYISPVRFFLHEPTRRALLRAGLMPALENHPDFELRPLGSYPEFTTALVQSRYIMTDGGSIQEEASYLAKPCLILRRATERSHGLGTTAKLVSMDMDVDLEFLRGVHSGNSYSPSTVPPMHAPRIILDSLYSEIP